MEFAFATFVIVLAIVLGGYWGFVVRLEDRESRSLQKRLKVSQTSRLVRPDLLKTERPLSRVPAVDRLLKHTQSFSTPLQRQIEWSGLPLTVGVVVLGSVFLATVVCVGTFFATRLITAGLILGLAAGSVPFMFLRMKARSRVAVFEEQFPEALDLIARALRAGHAFTTGLTMVADEIPEPVGTEFRLVHDRQNYGMPLDDALRAMARRVPLLDARFFVTAVLTQRESGGNLAEVLDNVAKLMRDRFTVKRQVRAVSAHGRITGWVLAFLAPAIAGVLLVVAPDHILMLVRDSLGIQMVVGALVLQIVGVALVRKIVDIEV
jgi:tight adherence protein B